MDVLVPKSYDVAVTHQCRYLLDPPAANSAHDPLLIVAAHGYGMNARLMLDLAQKWYEKRHWVASIEAPHPFYLGQTPGVGGEGYNWGTKSNWQAVVRLHHEILLRVIEKTTAQCGVSRRRTVLLGFSQPVGLNYRLIATHPEAVGGLIGVCGGPPGDWEGSPDYGEVSVPILHVSRSEDEFYGETVREMERRLRLRIRDLEYHILPGKHRFPTAGKSIAEAWERRAFA
jgi:predicted esterase